MAIYNFVADKPAHVPPHLVFDFDHHRDPGLFVDPHLRVLKLTQEAPALFWTPYNGGHWIALSYEYAFHVLRAHEDFSSSLMPPEIMFAFGDFKLPGGGRVPRITPIMLDPPDHTRMRAPLARAFAPKTVAKLVGDIDALATELVEAVLPLGRGDFLSAVIEQLPVRIFLRMMGLPQDRIEEFRTLVRALFEPANDDAMMIPKRMRQIGDAMADTIAARRDAPQDDLISQLWSIDIEGVPIDVDQMEDYCALLFLAGLDTVINVMGHGVRHLATHPELQAELRAHPDLVGDAMEEMMRRYSVASPIRRARHDTAIGNQLIKQNDLVVCYLSAAGMDSAQFPEPQNVDIARENKTHMLFGAGPHRCLGSHLARLEIKALYHVMLAKLPEFRLDPAKPIVFHAGNMLAVSSLPLRWD